MKKNFKAFIPTIILAAVAFVLAVSGLSCFLAEKHSFPASGIYFAEHNTWLGWTDNRYNPYFDLQLYEVGGGESFLEFTEMTLRDKEGKEYPLKDASIQTIFSDIFFSVFRITCVMDRLTLGEGEIVLTQAVLTSPDGTEHRYPIGTITLFTEEGDTESPLQFSSGTSGSSVLNSYNIQVTNSGSAGAAISELKIGLNGIGLSDFGYYDGENQYHSFEGEIWLDEGESVILHCEFEGEDSFRRNPFSQLRPVISYSVKGKASMVSVTTTAEYFAAFTRAEIKEYLWGLYEQAIV